MSKPLLLVVLALAILSCSKRVGQYKVRLSYPERKTLSVAVKDSSKAAYFIDTLAKIHKGLVRSQIITRIDTFFSEPVSVKKETPAQARYSIEEYERMEKALKYRVWSIMDSLKLTIADRDAFAKTIARESMPIMASGKINTDTVNIVDGPSHFRAYMHKGTLVGELKKDRTALSIRHSSQQTTIAPSVNCPPPRQWWSFWQSRVAIVAIVLLGLVLLALVMTKWIF